MPPKDPERAPDPADTPERDDHVVRIGDLDIAYTANGAGDGPSFVLVHGIGMGHGVFRALADELGTVGRVYALDLPGFGDSPAASVGSGYQPARTFVGVGSDMLASRRDRPDGSRPS